MGEASLVPSEIFANRDVHEDQLVLVRGYLSIEPDSICLIDPDHSSDTEPPRNSLFSVLGLELLQPNFEKFQGKVIVFRARFKSRVAKDNQFLLNGCGRPGVQIESDQTPIVLP